MRTSLSHILLSQIMDLKISKVLFNDKRVSKAASPPILIVLYRLVSHFVVPSICHHPAARHCSRVFR